MTGDKATVNIVVQPSGRMCRVTLPVYVPICQFRPTLLNQLELAPSDTRIQPVWYLLVHVAEEVVTVLGDHDTLGCLGVRDGALLWIIAWPHRSAGESVIVARKDKLSEDYTASRPPNLTGRLLGYFLSEIFRKVTGTTDSKSDKGFLPSQTGRETVGLGEDLTPVSLGDHEQVAWRLVYNMWSGRLTEADWRILESACESLERRLGKTLNQLLPAPPRLALNYLDFHLQITYKAHGRYQVDVLDSPAGRVSGDFQLPNRVSWMGNRTRCDWKRNQELGQNLFRQLFQGEVSAVMEASVQAAQAQGNGLRIKLYLDRAPDLMNLPWEYLYDPDRRMFLALREDILLTQFVSGPIPQPIIHVERPLRILAIAADPVDHLSSEVKEEQKKLDEALCPFKNEGIVTVEWVQGSSLTELSDHLNRTDKRYHVLHFIGYSGYDRSGDGVCRMVTGHNGFLEVIPHHHLAGLLSREQQLFRLAVFNMCGETCTGLVVSYAGFASSLLQTCTLAAVVGMRSKITDRAAITFASRFYGALATGKPVDTAVATARIATAGLKSEMDWASPVLYMRSPDGRLFDFADRQTV